MKRLLIDEKAQFLGSGDEIAEIAASSWPTRAMSAITAPTLDHRHVRTDDTIGEVIQVLNELKLPA